ncbi:MAG: hypothetical protein ACFHWX_08195 [Bacteroidota bacterium]
MKNLALILTGILFISVTGLSAQNKLKEKDIVGQWKLIINLDEEFDKAKKELEDDDDNIIGSIILGSVEGLVTSILDKVDIYMDFQKDGTLKIMVEAFDEKNVDYSNWSINSQGQLIIDDTDEIDTDHWTLEDGILVGYDDDGDKNMAYMVKII